MMQQIALIASLVTELGVIIGIIIPILRRIARIAEGEKCQLRSTMLKTYYHNRESETVRQYEYENFISCYSAYKALGGNSFVDKIYSEINSWEIIT